MNDNVIEQLKKVLPADRILVQEPMRMHCSFRTGGPADLFLRVSSREELESVLRILKEVQIPAYLLGRGTNVLIADEGIRGAVVTMADHMDRIEVSGNAIRAEAGAPLSRIAAAAKEHGLTGLEFAAGIPGSLGGAILMNAGAYGGEMKQVVREVTMWKEPGAGESSGEAQEGTVVTIPGEEMEFGYRTSRVKKEGGIVLSAVFELEQGDPAEIAAKMEDLAARRRDKQPLEYPSAGSTFKRPEGDFAGRLIEEAGLRGFSVGGAQVSEKHCGFVINRGGATSADVQAVIDAVRTRVYETSGRMLEREVIYLGMQDTYESPEKDI